MMIRKLLNIVTPVQRLMVMKDVDEIMNNCASIASIEFKEQKENR